MDIYLILAVMGFAGFSVAFYIHYQKTNERSLVCPIGTHCDPVVRSGYSKFVGIPLEYLGMLYYTIIVFFSLSTMLKESFMPDHAPFWMLILSITALLFSLYLVGLQLFVLRSFCSWCLASALLTFLIFITTLSHISAGFVDFLNNGRYWISAAHIFAILVGTILVVVSSMYFFRFLADSQISVNEASILHHISDLVWAALAVFAITGLGLYLPETTGVNYPPPFWMHLILFLVIIVNTTVFSITIMPKITQIHFEKKEGEHARDWWPRYLSLTLEIIALASWIAMLGIALFEYVV